MTLRRRGILATQQLLLAGLLGVVALPIALVGILALSGALTA
jgi:hypothetical protein